MNTTKLVAFAGLVGSSTAFVAPSGANGVARVSASKPRAVVSMTAANDEYYSTAVPFLPKNKVLDSYDLSGNAAFDPLNLATDRDTLLFYREAEQKHGRLAMLAALGWVFEELFDGRLAAALNDPDLLVRPDADGIGLAPNLLNGGLTSTPFLYWFVVLGLTSALEVQFQAVAKKITDAGREPGDYSFDPFGLYPKDAEGQLAMRTREIKHGRLAMLAVTAFAFQEKFSKIPVVEETPALFGLTPEEKLVEGEVAAEVTEVAKEGFNAFEYALHALHLI